MRREYDGRGTERVMVSFLCRKGMDGEFFILHGDREWIDAWIEHHACGRAWIAEDADGRWLVLP